MPVKIVCVTILVPVLLGTGQLLIASTLADPTRPANSALFSSGRAHESGGWVLSSTLIAEDRRVAVINGKHVSEGESIGNATVLKIRKLDVLLQAAGKRITLKLLPDIVKNIPSTMEPRL